MRAEKGGLGSSIKGVKPIVAAGIRKGASSPVKKVSAHGTPSALSLTKQASGSSPTSKISTTSGGHQVVLS